MKAIKRVVERNLRSQVFIECIRSKMVEVLPRKNHQLIKENIEKCIHVEAALNQLTKLKLIQSTKQISVSAVGVRRLSTKATKFVEADAADNFISNSVKEAHEERKLPKGNNPLIEKVKPFAAPEIPVDIGRLDLRVGKVIDVNNHPDAHSLYLMKIDCGEASPRIVISGLVKFISIEQIQNRMVVVMCNLKATKMRGILSEAMIMCASTSEKVEMLSPPDDSVPGDLVHCQGFDRQPDIQINPKKKVFEACVSDLKTNEDLVACYKGEALHVLNKGNIIVNSLKNVNIK